MAEAKHAVPTGIKILGWLAVIAGVLGFVGSVFTLATLSTLPPEAAALVSTPQMVLGIILSIAAAVGGFYLLKLRKLGWQLLVIALVISTLNNIWTAIGLAELGIAAVPGIVIGLLVIYYLWTKKKLFK